MKSGEEYEGQITNETPQFDYHKYKLKGGKITDVKNVGTGGDIKEIKKQSPLRDRTQQ